MVLTSNTGLMPALQNYKPYSDVNTKKLELRCEVTPAPFILRPYAGLYNPFSPACSVLCNHPANLEAKEYVKKAKTVWNQDTRSFEHFHEGSRSSLGSEENERSKSMQDLFTEDMFRRYAETDSRPHTPALTFASGKSICSRRCLTPDQQPKRASIVLDLRRSHSQETLFFHGLASESTSLHGASTIETSTLPFLELHQYMQDKNGKDKKEYLPPLASPALLSRRSHGSSKNQLKALYPKKSIKGKGKAKASQQKNADSNVDGGDTRTKDEDSGRGEVRRRGKRRKKKGLNARLPSALLLSQTSVDPETQVAEVDNDSHNPSSRGSIAPQTEVETLVLPVLKVETAPRKLDSFLDDDILKYLHREVDEDAIERELDPKRRFVLEEAFRTKPQRVFSQEVQNAINDLRVPQCCLGDWLHIPRVFTRKSSRFSLPIDTMALQSMNAMQYIAQYVAVDKSKQLLYLTVSQKFRPGSYKMPVQDIIDGLKLMMGGILSDESAQHLKALLAWETYVDKENFDDEINIQLSEKRISPKVENDDCKDVKVIKHRTWCGVCAISERMFGNYKARDIDPPDIMELNDFAMLETKLAALNVEPALLEILNVIRTS